MSGSDVVKYTLGGILFSWDDRKAVLNFKKHKVTFELAAEVFFDGNAIFFTDSAYGEERFNIVGITYTTPISLLFVVYTERLTLSDINLFRIISARVAEKKERETYERNLPWRLSSQP